MIWAIENLRCEGIGRQKYDYRFQVMILRV